MSSKFLILNNVGQFKKVRNYIDTKLGYPDDRTKTYCTPLYGEANTFLIQITNFAEEVLHPDVKAMLVGSPVVLDPDHPSVDVLTEQEIADAIEENPPGWNELL